MRRKLVWSFSAVKDTERNRSRYGNTGYSRDGVATEYVTNISADTFENAHREFERWFARNADGASPLLINAHYFNMFYEARPNDDSNDDSKSSEGQE